MIIHRIESQNNVRKKRVAAYARVSTDQEQQHASFEIQVRYYSELIRRNPDWEFIKVYADPGKSGTGVKKRPGF
jgi:DNA invertase Pin-like site-specific DNA recombinase